MYTGRILNRSQLKKRLMYENDNKLLRIENKAVDKLNSIIENSINEAIKRCRGNSRRTILVRDL